MDVRDMENYIRCRTELQRSEGRRIKISFFYKCEERFDVLYVS